LQALGKHPCILSMPGEAPLITSIGGAVWLFEFGTDREYYQNSLRYPKEYLYAALRNLCFEYASGRHYGLNLILKGLRNTDFSYLKKTLWCAKTFPDSKVSGALVKLYPSARFISIIRNGCDVVRSMTKFAGFNHQEFEKNCTQWASAVDKYLFLSSFEYATQVRHEKMIAHPEEFFNDLFSFLRLRSEPHSADFVKNHMVHPLDQPNQENVYVRDVFERRKAPYDDWSKEQRDTFKRICGDKMEELGYDLSF
jgi:hypothetical protein